jgi:hypothetical protein
MILKGFGFVAFFASVEASISNSSNYSNKINSDEM